MSAPVVAQPVTSLIVCLLAMPIYMYTRMSVNGINTWAIWTLKNAGHGSIARSLHVAYGLNQCKYSNNLETFRSKSLFLQTIVNGVRRPLHKSSSQEKNVTSEYQVRSPNGYFEPRIKLSQKVNFAADFIFHLINFFKVPITKNFIYQNVFTKAISKKLGWLMSFELL